jgi:hypothetical protein
MYARIKSPWENDINTEKLENTRRRDVPTVHAGARKLIIKAYPFDQPEAEGERILSHRNAKKTLFSLFSKCPKAKEAELCNSFGVAAGSVIITIKNTLVRDVSSDQGQLISDSTHAMLRKT